MPSLPSIGEPSCPDLRFICLKHPGKGLSILKDIHSNKLMKWLMGRGLSPRKAYELLQFVGAGSFFLFPLVAILLDAMKELNLPELSVGIVGLVFLAGYLGLFVWMSWLTHVLWLFLFLFGPVDLILAFAVEWEDPMGRWIFLVLGVVLTGLGLWLLPIQRRNQAAVNVQLNEAERKPAQNKQTQTPKPQPKEPQKQEDRKPDLSLHNAKLRYRVCYNLMQNMKKDPAVAAQWDPEHIQKRFSEAARNLGDILQQMQDLWILRLDVPGNDPLYLSADGRLELFSNLELAQNAQQKLLEALDCKIAIQHLDGPETIATILTLICHNGYTCFRLDNGSQTACDVWLKDIVTYREDVLVDEKNRNLRHCFNRSKLHNWIANEIQDQAGNPHVKGLRQMALTMKLSGLRELGNTLLYALASYTGENQVYVTPGAQEKIGQWLPGSGYEKTAIGRLALYPGELNLAYVNAPGEQGSIAKGRVCVFTDLTDANMGLNFFRHGGMRNSIVILTFDEIASRASQCAGLVVDMQTMNFTVDTKEFGTVLELRALDGPIVVNLKDKKEETSNPQTEAPRCMDTGSDGAWFRWDYQWPHRFGFDFMVRAAQWLAENDLMPQTLVTGSMGTREVEHIEAFREKGTIADAVGPEAGLLGLGGMSQSGKCLLKIYWYNQTNVVRIFTSLNIPQTDMDAYIQRLYEAQKEF